MTSPGSPRPPKCGAGSSECFAFRAPPQFTRALRAAGFTVVSNANNHSFDYGEAGQEETRAALDRAGIAHTGMPKEIEVVRSGGRRLAFLGFASYANTAPLTDLEAARELIRRARKQADIVVVAFHAGAEGSGALHVTGEVGDPPRHPGRGRWLQGRAARLGAVGRRGPACPGPRRNGRGAGRDALQ